MKKQLLLMLLLVTGFQGFSQTKGISYQAVILNPEAEESEGDNAQANILANSIVSLEFTFVNASGKAEYQEQHSTKTDSYGMINLIIGTGIAQGSNDFAGILWDGTVKKLKVGIDFSGGSNFSKLSEQDLTYMPQPLTKESIQLIAANTASVYTERQRAEKAEQTNAANITLVKANVSFMADKISSISSVTAKGGGNPFEERLTINEENVLSLQGEQTTQNIAIALNTDKVSYPGDQDILGIAANATAISTIESEQTTQNTAIALNTSKISYPGDQDISGISTNAGAISTIESEQTIQNTAIELNNEKVSYPGDQDISGILTNAGAISTIESEQRTQNTAIALNTTSISDEATRALAAEGVLTNAISDEAITARTAESGNAGAIATETTRATTAEGLNETAISDEATRALATEGVLTTAIVDETITARAAESANANAITAEETARIAGDNANAAAANAYSDAADAIQSTALNTAISVAQSAAQIFATDADIAQTIVLQGYADQAESDAIATAAADATTKANAAEAAAISAAAADATTKVLVETNRAIATEAANAGAISTHAAKTDNPHAVTKTQVGLENVDNTSDASKPVSALSQTALNGKVDDAQVLTNVPLNALFSDSQLTEAQVDAFANNNGYLSTHQDLSGLEPKITTKNTAFNKDFGTTAGTVLEGNTVTISSQQASDITTNNEKITIPTGGTEGQILKIVGGIPTWVDPATGTGQIFYEDSDEDGYGDINSSIVANAAPNGYVDNNTDCDDGDSTNNPNTVWYIGVDTDGDTFFGSTTSLTQCISPGEGYTKTVPTTPDCDDTTPDGAIFNPDTVWYIGVDADNDTYIGSVISLTQCESPGVDYTLIATTIEDCNDGDSRINPASIWYLDADGDNYAISTTTQCASPGAGYAIAVLPLGDCNDNDAAINPATVWYLDADSDNYAASTTTQCTSPGAGYTTTVLPFGDCDDDNEDINPGVSEVLGNGIDDNCNGAIDEIAVSGCTDPSAPNYNALANTDDGSCIVLAIGDTYQGGIIFYLDGNGGGLIAAPTDQSTGAEWGCAGFNISGADGTAIGTGAQNTIDIEAGCTTVGTAADICANLTLGGYSDWFLPSKDELNQMYLNLHQQGLGGFLPQIYRSSSETSSNGALGQFFNDGNQNSVWFKGYDTAVRAVRAVSTPILGCTDPTALNYDASADIDDGSCIAAVYGCMDPTAFNYNASSNTDDGSCIAAVNGCTDPTAFNYDASANTDDGSCIAVVNGCMDPTALNYDASANTDDGSCIAAVNGCTDPTALNYDASANTDDGSCTYPLAIGDTYQGGIIFYLAGNGGGLIAAPSDQSSATQWGCYPNIISGADGTAIGTGQQNTIDMEAGCAELGKAADICANLTLNGYSDWFLPSKDELNQMYINRAVIGGVGTATYWSSSEYSSSIALIQDFGNVDQIYANKFQNFRVRAVRAINYNGCTDPTAFNYDALAFMDDGSCIAAVYGCTDPTACNYNSAANVDDASCSYAVSNADCSGACLTGYTTDGTGACVAVVNGCTDPTAFNYDASANTDDGSCVAVVTQFDFTASVQTFTVPAGVTSISVDAYGASGTTSIPGYGGNDYLGKGGRVQTNLTVTPGEVLNIYVGGTFNYTGLVSQSNMGGWNGGGNEGGNGFAGGGATDIRIGGTSLSDRVIVSGGGGGRKNSSSSANVGHGGGLVGQKGALVISFPLETPGKGGTQSNGGQGGCDYGLCAVAGTLGSGSNGRSISGNSSGGGGGGYYGGGGGADGGGGGGSSYTDPTLCSSVVHTQGARTGKGQLTITIL
jgi:hypothetical protein